MKLLIATAVLVSIMAFRTDKAGNVRLSLWDNEGFRSAVLVQGTAPMAWFKAHVSRDSMATFAESDAMTVTMEFTGDTVQTIR